MAEWTLPTIDDEAAAWAARFLSCEISKTEQQTIDEWLTADIRHQQAYLGYLDIIVSTDQLRAAIAKKT